MVGGDIYYDIWQPRIFLTSYRNYTVRFIIRSRAMAGVELTANEHPNADTCPGGKNKKSWRIDDTIRRAVAVVLVAIVWVLFSLPTIFFLREATAKSKVHIYKGGAGAGKRFMLPNQWRMDQGGRGEEAPGARN